MNMKPGKMIIWKNIRIHNRKISVGLKKHRKNILGAAAFLLIFVMILSFVTTFFKMTDSVNIATIEGFYKEPENSIDVMMIGASEVYADYSATTAWKDYGYTSYSLGVSGVPGSLYKSMLRESLTRQHPKLVVFEVNGFLQKDSYYDRTAQLHSWIDNIHDEANKADTIAEVVPEAEQDNFINPLKLYHSNWKNIGKCAGSFTTRFGMMLSDISYMKGFSSIAKSSDCPSDKKKTLYFTDKSRDYLTDLLEYCKSCGVEKVLFARFPHEKEIKNPEVLTEVEDLVKSYGYDFASFENDKGVIGIENRNDFYNSEHLNVKGSQKFTRFVGQYLSDNYRLPVEHSAKITSQWKNCAKRADEVIDACAKDTDMKSGNHYFEMSAYMPYRSTSLLTGKN